MSRLRNAFITTGIVAWLGGLTTAFAVSSCDVETCSEMDPNDPLCDPEPRTSPEELGQPTSPCDMVARPSVHVVPVKRFDDHSLPVLVDKIWFEHEGQTHEARCIHDEAGCSGAWIAGYELAGPITVSTEYCDTVVDQTVVVQETEDGCHVQSQFMLLDVSTHGCLTAEPTPLPPPPPPWALTQR